MGEWVSADKFIREYNESIPHDVRTPQSSWRTCFIPANGDGQRRAPSLDDYDHSPDSDWEERWGYELDEEDDAETTED